MSVDSRKDFVRDQKAVFLVILAVFQVAFLGISLGAIDEEVRQEGGVKEDQDPVPERIGQETPAPRRGQFEKVLEVSRHAPEAAGQEQRRFLRAVARPAIDDCVRGPDEGGFLALDKGCSVSGT